ncbi:MAG: DUF1109 domain-containing protein [Mesorhizobium sp.]|uniref:DUF1109 domain-containing protein n=1 Tax=Mesorhizobium sp. TaxID=1871066 RepID=UPI000FE7B66B|nr:DUF1109 domain-containing protein [Mesorhizobium sp.]RWA75435.1 MAG: DUF1109 domain-containing protein [Mesorhizobium sp.]
MIKTSDLISSLAKDLPPVRRLRPPLVRASCWLLLAAVVLILVGAAQGLRPDLAERVNDPAFVARMVASLLTGTLAAVSAFFVSLPDRSRLWLLLPLPALGVWLSNIGYQCLTQWISVGPDGFSLGETVRCFATLVLTSLPLSLVMLLMLRHAAPLRPRTVALMGSLSVAAITATALSLFHTLDASVMILVWNFGTAIILVALGGIFSKKIFRWVAPRTIVASE